jgi:hypothetical protein
MANCMHCGRAFAELPLAPIVLPICGGAAGVVAPPPSETRVGPFLQNRPQKISMISMGDVTLKSGGLATSSPPRFGLAASGNLL